MRTVSPPGHTVPVHHEFLRASSSCDQARTGLGLLAFELGLVGSKTSGLTRWAPSLPPATIPGWITQATACCLWPGQLLEGPALLQDLAGWRHLSFLPEVHRLSGWSGASAVCSSLCHRSGGRTFLGQTRGNFGGSYLRGTRGF